MSESGRNPDLARDVEVPVLRPAVPEDEGFLFALFCASRAPDYFSTGWSGSQLELLLRLQFRGREQDYAGRPSPAAPRCARPLPSVSIDAADSGSQPDESALCDSGIIGLAFLAPRRGLRSTSPDVESTRSKPKSLARLRSGSVEVVVCSGAGVVVDKIA